MLPIQKCRSDEAGKKVSVWVLSTESIIISSSFLCSDIPHFKTSHQFSSTLNFSCININAIPMPICKYVYNISNLQNTPCFMQLNKKYFHFIFALFCLVFPSGRRRKGEYSRRRNVYINFSGKHINKHSFKWFYLHTFVSNDSYRMTWQIFCRMFINNCFSSSCAALDI